MSLLTEDDRNLLRESLASYLADRYSEAEHRSRADSELSDLGPHWKALAEELGLFGLSFPPEAGGMGGSAADHAMVMEQIGHSAMLEPYLSTIVIGGSAIAASQLPDANGMVAAIMAGDTVIAFAHGEAGARYNPADIATTANLTANTYVLDGRKAVVFDAPLATHLLVSARTQGGISLFLVSADAPGISRRDYRTLSGRPASEISFVGVTVPDSMLLVEEGRALPLIGKLLDEAAVMVCAEAIGIMDRMLQDTIAYTQQRVQFGKPLSSFQALQHRMADMLIRKEHSRALVNLTVTALAAPNEDRMRAVSAAKVYVGKSVRFVAQQAVQLHGGMGVTDELFLGRFFKRAMEVERQFGSVGFHLKRYSDLRRTQISNTRSQKVFENA